MKTSTFVAQARAVHGNRYQYDQVVYVNATTPVVIVCTTHGTFEQQPYLHLKRKAGCPRCSYINRATVRRQKTQWLPFEVARQIVHSQKFQTISDWNDWSKSDDKPCLLPACPKVTYKDQWQGWGDWLGNQLNWLPFEEARQIVHTFNLRSYEDWIFFCCALKKKPINIPFEPKKIYKNEWRGWGDWLGYVSRSNGALPGVIYILQDPNLPANVVKIGRSYRLEKRLYEHNRTTGHRLKVLASFPVQHMADSEKAAHQAALTVGVLYKYYNHKEYFMVDDVDRVIAVVENVIV